MTSYLAIGTETSLWVPGDDPELNKPYTYSDVGLLKVLCHVVVGEASLWSPQ